MRFIILILLILKIIPSFGNDTKKRQRRFSIEPGVNTSILLTNRIKNNYKNVYLDPKNKHFYFIGISSLGFGYQINKNYKASISTSEYLQKFNSKEVKGDVISVYFILISLDLQKKLIQKNNFKYFGQISINYRDGVEGAAGNLRWYLPEYDVIYYNHQLGLGLGNGINYKVSKRFYLTADIGYYHFLKLPGMIGLVNVQPFYPKPINNVIIGNLKIGFLL